MVRDFIFGSAAAALLSGGAMAADLPNRAAPPQPTFVTAAPFFSWTGFYAGVNLGGAFESNGKIQTVGTPAFVGLGPRLVPGSLGGNASGFIGGITAGYNQQFGAFVAGIEGDFDYVGIKKSGSFVSPGTVLGTNLTTSASHKLDDLGTLRARLGYTPMDRLLVFATGGLAFGEVKDSGSVIANAAPTLAWSGSKTSTRAGYAVGGGVEYAFTNNITAKLEYLYYDLGRQTTSALGNSAVRSVAALNGVDYISRTRSDGSIVRAGLNFKF